MIALREAWQAGLFHRRNWASNIVAGAIVGVVAALWDGNCQETLAEATGRCARLARGD